MWLGPKQVSENTSGALQVVMPDASVIFGTSILIFLPSCGMLSFKLGSVHKKDCMRLHVLASADCCETAIAHISEDDGQKGELYRRESNSGRTLKVKVWSLADFDITKKRDPDKLALRTPVGCLRAQCLRIARKRLDLAIAGSREIMYQSSSFSSSKRGIFSRILPNPPRYIR